MAGSVNKVMLIGNLGRDAELKYTPGGSPVSKFSIATTETWTDKAGQRQERTEWHNIELWGKQAESLAEYLSKGKQVFVEGKLQTDKFEDKDGNKRQLTKVRADRITLLGGGASRAAHDESNASAGQPRRGRQSEPPPQQQADDDDVPF